ncbi:MAG TPA: hypothetical protein VHK64_02825 [Nocardioidaceae bacterium]|nr:hypothetical protein [Nocardioidaceae bacterium]
MDATELLALYERMALIRPGVSTADVVSVWPRAQEFGFPDEEDGAG